MRVEGYTVQTFTIRDLRERTGELVRGAEQGHLAIITKHGHPVFVAVPFDERMLREGVNLALAIKMFAEGVLSAGQAAKLADQPLETFMIHLGQASVPVIDHLSEKLGKENEIKVNYVKTH
jgi:prevent-host-death family protein